MSPGPDPWRLLGVRPGATADEVARAWRALAARHHPDVGGDAAHFCDLVAARDRLLALTRNPAPVLVVRRPSPAARLIRPLRRRIDRRIHPRVS